MEVSAAAALVEHALDEMIAGKVDRRAIRVWRQIDAAIERAELAADGSPTVENNGPPPTRHTTTILAVDEDPDFLAHVQRIGRDNLVHVLLAQTAERALEIAQQQPIDGAILDLSLGRHGGSEDCFGLARRLRALDGQAGLPLAVISERDRLADRIEAMHADTTFFLGKPLAQDDLLATASRFTAIRTAGRPRLLIVGQDPPLAARASRLLGDWSVSHLGQVEKVLDELDEMVPDALLLEVALPRLSGFDLCRLVRAVPRWQDLPVLFVAGDEDSRAARVACFEARGDDYLQREQLGDELATRLQVRLDRVRLKREAAERDHLTGLLTRGSFLRAMEARLGENRRRARPLALALIDIDDLEQGEQREVESSRGRVVPRFGRLVAARFRIHDLRSYWQGSEFVLALDGEAPDNARRILHRLLAEFRRMRFRGRDGSPLSVTFSAGIAGFPRDGSEVGTLMRVADQRLARARAEGPGRIIA
jgi:diguanylate cyclase (GGDEF)-like protein